MDVSKEKTEPPTEELMALVTAINKIIITTRAVVVREPPLMYDRTGQRELEKQEGK